MIPMFLGHEKDAHGDLEKGAPSFTPSCLFSTLFVKKVLFDFYLKKMGHWGILAVQRSGISEMGHHPHWSFSGRVYLRWVIDPDWSFSGRVYLRWAIEGGRRKEGRRSGLDFKSNNPTLKGGE